MATIYRINKGVNKPLEFKGLKAQYIAQLGIGLVMLLLFFSIMYVLGVPLYLSIMLVTAGGSCLFMWLSHASRTYGRYGLMKKLAKKRLPAGIRITSRMVFCKLNEQQ